MKQRFVCNNNYQKDLKIYSEKIFEKYGVSSQTAEREIMYMADSGNTVAEKLYADMIFFKKVAKTHSYREAFKIYLRSAGITVDEAGEWSCSGDSYPLSFWIIGYYLLNYRRSSVLKDCEEIDEIESMSMEDRFGLGLELACACIEHVGAPGAVNLAGRILRQVTEDGAMFEALAPKIKELLAGRKVDGIEITGVDCETMEACAALSLEFFLSAAREGYVYACNSLAIREGDAIIGMEDEDEIKEAIGRYVHYLEIAANKYEPYAANRLGLFYIEGEVKGTSEIRNFPEYKDAAKAKAYFTRATIYPDSNSAWAYLNLIKHFRVDYATNLDFLNEHMDRIKELNPRVYDIAMEL